MMMIHKALYPRDDINKLYVSSNKREKGFTSIQDSFSASMRRFEEYIKKCKEGLISGTKTIQTTIIIPREKMGRKNCMGISSTKQVKFYMKIFRHD